MLRARLRHERGWSNARILNISSRGLLVHAPEAPRRGSYVEVCKGQHRIIARVVWASEGRFGALTQDRLAVDSITMGIEPPAAATACETIERRLQPRQAACAEHHERSRRRSRTVEFACMVVFGCAAAFIVFDTVMETLSKPLSMVGAKLSAKD